jgi:SAM-dependent methyltransferase
MATDEGRATRIDTTVPHSARIWNYFLGGKDNYPVDRDAGDQYIDIYPDLTTMAQADRAFLSNVVTYLAGPAGIRQFLDIGTGLPTADNTHEVAQRVAPTSRIVYVDNDPLVLVHAEALLRSSPQGATDYIEADVREPSPILDAAADTLDFTQPVALMLLGILNFVDGTEHARQIVRELLTALAPGSYLAISHPTHEVGGAAYRQVIDEWNRYGSTPLELRSIAEIESFFDSVELLPPGVVSCSQWRPGARTDDPVAAQFCGLGRKP